MASLVAGRFKPKPQTLRRLSSSSSSTPPPPPSDQDPPEDPSAALFTDIKASLRRLAAEPRRIPLNPPKPDILSQNPDTTSLDDIRKHLAEVRSRSAVPSPSSAPKHRTSFQDLYQKSLLNRTADAEPSKSPATISYDAIRESLRLFRDKRSPGSGLSSSFREAADAKGSPTPRPNVPGRTEGLPRSIFGRELEKKDEGKGRRTDFLKAYTYEELGEKLRMLRPKGGDGKEVSFSLEELKERLVSLREMEEKGSGAMNGVGFDFASLRDSLQSMQQAKNNSNLTRMLFLSHIGGEVTPDYMLRPPKEQLVEKYFHPDLMSSAEKIKLELKSVRDEFKMSESDCGSARVQVAQLTTKIKHLSSVLHKKDKHSQKGLQAMVQRRKKLLKYLRRTDWDSYCFVLSKLGLRDAADYRT